MGQIVPPYQKSKENTYDSSCFWKGATKPLWCGFKIMKHYHETNCF